MAKKQKYYVVWDGVNPGVYNSWTECQAQIKGYPNAKYKSFSSMDDAQNAFHCGSYEENLNRKEKKVVTLDHFKNEILADSIAVDAACSGNPGIMEYRGVWTIDGTEIFRMGPFQNSTNNIGEFLALVHAIALLTKKGGNKTSIYTDSRTALSWVRKKKVNTKLSRNKANDSSFKLIERGEKWLKENKYKNQIIKWETKKWGEIPADFGRK